MTPVTDCLFCRIVTGQIPANLVAEGERVLAFRDLNPQAPTHVLVIPRDHHENVGALAADQQRWPNWWRWPRRSPRPSAPASTAWSSTPAKRPVSRCSTCTVTSWAGGE